MMGSTERLRENAFNSFAVVTRVKRRFFLRLGSVVPILPLAFGGGVGGR
jgi:hypothetical protein